MPSFVVVNQNQLIMTHLISFFSGLFAFVAESIAHNGLFILLSIIMASSISVYSNKEKLKNYFLRQTKFLVPGSTLFGAITPFCACGTMAVLFSFISTALPWGPIMAFLVSSPLMSPDAFILFSGFLGVKFALALSIASILMGLGAGYLANFLEKRTSFFDGQLVNLSAPKKNTSEFLVLSKNQKPVNGELRPILNLQTNSCCTQAAEARECCSASEPLATEWQGFMKRQKLDLFAKEIYTLGFKKIIPLFLLFTVIAYLAKVYIPTHWIVGLFSNSVFAVPLAGLIGLPLYVTDSAALPLLQILHEAGASNGALMAFLITGPGTSVAVISGLSLIMKRKAIMLYIAMIYIGAVIAGFVYGLL
jgi:uncharacterized protein